MLLTSGLECFTSNVNFGLNEDNILKSKLVNCSAGSLACFISSKLNTYFNIQQSIFNKSFGQVKRQREHFKLAQV